MIAIAAYRPRVPNHAIDVIESGQPRDGYKAFNLDANFKFSTAALESYAFARWQPVIYDAMLVAAAIEYADRSFARPGLGWRRDFSIHVPVLEPARWSASAVSEALRDATGFLTGDGWRFKFVQRQGPTPWPPQDCFQFHVTADAVIAFSDGMDSRAVAGLVSAAGRNPVRVRVGSKAAGRPARGEPVPFAVVPYNVKADGETSARSRGFKFAVITGIAAYLANIDEILLPESGQGVFGPALVTVTTQAYPDYRSHPLFTTRMERFLTALLHRPFRYVFPRLWSTKGETLRAYAALPNGGDWHTTRSCWRSARHCSVEQKLKQCGVCAACMLRRMSIDAAGLQDDHGDYVCSDLSAPAIDDGMQSGFKRMGQAFKEYAIAGAQYLDHLADLAVAENRPVLRRHAVLTGRCLELPAVEVEGRLASLIERHADEWQAFLDHQGPRSFLKQWTRTQ